MFEKNTHRLIAAGFVGASCLIAAPPAQADTAPPEQNVISVNGGGYGGSWPTPQAPGIGMATSGVSGGPITAAAAWSAPPTYYSSTKTITGYRVRATAYKYEQVPRYDAYNQRLYWVWAWVVVGSTTSAVQPAEARTLSMTLPQTGTYSFEVQAINPNGDSPYSPASNRVTGQ